MHTDKFIVKISGKCLKLKNISGMFLDNCFISVKNVFGTEVINNEFYCEVDEEIDFLVKEDSFTAEWADKKLEVSVYNEHRLAYQKNFNDKSRCFVLLSNKEFEPITERLIQGICRYSNVDILHYTIDYESTIDFPNLSNIEFSIKGDSNDRWYMQFAKPPVFIDVLNKGYQNAVFLDADIQVRSNIDSLFELISEIGDGPVLQKQQWEYTSVNGMYIPGPLLSEHLKIEKQYFPQAITNVVIFNQKQKDLFEEWEKICFSERIQELKKIEFLHDELLLNCLMWKKRVAPKLFRLSLNVTGAEDVNFFYNFNYSTSEYLVDMNKYKRGHLAQSYLNYDYEKICCFHCVKDTAVADEINQIIYRKEIGEDFDAALFNFYEKMNKTEKRTMNIPSNPEFLVSYINGVKCEIKGGPKKDYTVEFYDGKMTLLYRSVIQKNMWTAINKKYYDNYTVIVKDGDEIVHKENFNPTGKRVYIALESKSLGDTLAWFPYAEEFRKKYGCEVIVSTFMNDLFAQQYPDLIFVKPGETVHNLYAMFCIGWYYDDQNNSPDLSRNPIDFRAIPLQKTSSDILGLEFKEVKPKLNVPNVEKKKKVGIGFHSTAQSKYWNNPKGWQEVTDYLVSQGYEVMVYSKEGDDYMGNKFPVGVTKFRGGSLQDVINDFATCEYFIGIGSGLSWLAWASGLHVVLVSGFSTENAEMSIDCTRIINKNVCHGCFNRHRLDAGDWNWCPDHKGTARQFECSKQISGERVIEALKKINING